MKVRYLLRYYPTLTETFVVREVAALARRGVEVDIATLGPRGDGALQEDLPAVPVLTLPRRPLVGRLQQATPGMRWLADHQRPKDVARLPWLARRLEGVHRLHVHFAGEAAELAAALRLDGGPPYTLTVHAADLFKPRPSLATVLQGAQSVFTVATHHQPLLAELGVSATLLRCGPDLSTFQPVPLPGGPLRAVFIGRHVPKKGLDTLLAAWSALPSDARLVLLSDHEGPLPPGVSCPGLQPPSEVRATLSRSNLVVLPCRRAPDGDLDGVPLALMEGLAMGRPVLSTPVSGVPELVDEEVGWLVAPDSPEALATALLAAHRHPEERARRGARGPARLRSRGFTLDHQVDGLLQAWARS